MLDSLSMSSSDRLQDWKLFRNTLADQSLKKQLEKVVEYWSNVPYVNFYLDFDLPVEEWPTPWELIHEGDFCRSGIGYLMYKTLELATPEEEQTSDLKLVLIKDLKNKETYVAVLAQDEYLLNYSHAEVELWKNVKDHCETICICETKSIV